MRLVAAADVDVPAAGIDAGVDVRAWRRRRRRRNIFWWRRQGIGASPDVDVAAAGICADVGPTDPRCRDSGGGGG